MHCQKFAVLLLVVAAVCQLSAGFSLFADVGKFLKDAADDIDRHVIKPMDEHVIKPIDRHVVKPLSEVEFDRDVVQPINREVIQPIGKVFQKQPFVLPPRNKKYSVSDDIKCDLKANHVLDEVLTNAKDDLKANLQRIPLPNHQWQVRIDDVNLGFIAKVRLSSNWLKGLDSLSRGDNLCEELDDNGDVILKTKLSLYGLLAKSRISVWTFGLRVANFDAYTTLDEAKIAVAIKVDGDKQKLVLQKFELDEITNMHFTTDISFLPSKLVAESILDDHEETLKTVGIRALRHEFQQQLDKLSDWDRLINDLMVNIDIEYEEETGRIIKPSDRLRATRY